MRGISITLFVTFLLLTTLPALLSAPVPSSSSLLSSLFPSSASLYQAFTSYFTTSPVYHPRPADAQSFLHYDTALTGSRHVVDVRAALVRSLTLQTKAWLSMASGVSPLSAPSDDASMYPYWRMIPAYVSSVVAPAASQWSSPCFADVSASMRKVSASSYALTFELKGATSSLCSDAYLLATVEGFKLETFSCVSPFRRLCNHKATVEWDASNATAAELFDVDTKGVRVFRFQDDAVSTLKELETTLTLFEPLETQQVSDGAAAANRDFLSKYAGVNVSERSVQSVDVDEALIHSGDFFGVLRLDGLDPMLAWAMGSVTGHTVLALWMDEPQQPRQLYIVESTNNNSYWQVNGIQRTPYRQWLKQAKNASYNVVWAPLSPAAAAAFNESAASAYFFTQEGFDYGYHNLLWGWQDTVSANYPCLPPSFSLCLTPHHVQILFAFIDRVLPTIGDVLFSQAWNKRLGTEGLSFAELLQAANQTVKIPAEQVPVLVERDEWQYATSRYGAPAVGPAQVCCVFVCNVWKAAGLFANLSSAFQCAEQTNFDDYSLDFLTTLGPQLPKQCSSADPSNPLCQLEGKYSLELGPAYGTRSPYPHMGESCPSLAPDYSRPAKC